MNTPRKVYIAGPMSGYVDYNYEAFHEASERWKEKGWAVLNPADHFLGDQNLPMSYYMRGAIHAVLQADVVALLPGWSESEGATMEVLMAQKLGLDFYHAITAKLIEVEPFTFADAMAFRI